jgi:hypothetical protein
MNCVVCHQDLDPALAPELSHPACGSASFYDPVGDEINAADTRLKQQLLEMILHAERQSPRSKQKQIGPSEMGEACDRRIAYRLAGIPEINVAFDPWPATVGTAIHAWLDGAAQLWNTTRENVYLTEQEIPFEFGGIGHGDLYYDGCVIDWKSASKEVMRNVKKNGPPSKHVTQVHLYGYGYRRLGHKVDRVALAFVPRAGWIKDMFVWSEPYNEQVAQAAITRMYQVAARAVQLQVLQHPHRWEQLDATPSDECGRCPWFNSLRTAEEGASDQGCPGTAPDQGA